MKNISFLLLASLAVSSTLLASEVDNFTYRNIEVKDSKELINKNSNDLIDQVVEKTNRQDGVCNEQNLYKNLRKKIHNGLFGQFNRYINKSNEMERILIVPRDSIYGDLNLKNSLGMGLHWNWIDKQTYASIINVNNHYIGVDKFEHFAGSGFKYFKNYYLDKKSIESTLNIGNIDEHGMLGEYSDGVISYGDMAAEFNGMRFWNDFLAKNSDILGSAHGPYLKCEKDHWVKVKEVDFSVYVDAAWDESLNCSNFRNKDILNKVKQRLKKLEDVTGKSYTCPMNRELITSTASKYGTYAQKIINTDGQKAEKN